MSHWAKLALAATSALTLLAVALTTGGAATALRAAGVSAVLVRSTAPIDAQAGGGGATSPGLGPIQMSIGSNWTLVDKLTVSGPLTVTCGPFLPGSGFSQAQVVLSQAAGHTVGHAVGSITPACDGVTHTYVVTATVQDVPFRSGTATVNASAFASGTDPFTFQFESQSGQAGPQSISIKK
jgi:hypothetical protein